jgi:hypothetical protein
VIIGLDNPPLDISLDHVADEIYWSFFDSIQKSDQTCLVRERFKPLYQGFKGRRF